ncbi:YsnF/AvaK domain-containing protein [Sporosarcina sp. 179-K 3D1 HS]|uniref:YsnF/AvaK domain-containing protein n=1 Tax=Sporosarcina sp. 179-K 3D1 HS TaxID=3232169 RepID=UPI0039A1F12F
MKNEKRFVGLFHSESALMDKMDQLRTEGYSEDNMYVIAKDETNLSMLRSRTSAEVETAHETWLDRFMNFISGEDHVWSMFDRLGIDEVEARQYTNDINNGALLLYVDEGEAYRLYEGDREYFSAHNHGMNPNIERSGTYMADDMDTDSIDTSQLGRVGAEALLDRTDYETPPSYGMTDEERMLLREERLQVNKRDVETGHVSLEKDVVEERQSMDVPVSHEEVRVERRPVMDGDVYRGRANIMEDDESIHIPITEERLEVTKKPVVTEEIVVSKRDVERMETVEDTVKREEARLERDGDVEVDGVFDETRSKWDNL